MILGLTVRIMPIQTLLNLLFEINLLAKTVNQQHSCEVSQVTSLEENLNISGSFGHGTQTVHFGRFLSQIGLESYYPRLSSVNTNLKYIQNFKWGVHLKIFLHRARPYIRNQRQLWPDDKFYLEHHHKQIHRRHSSELSLV